MRHGPEVVTFGETMALFYPEQERGLEQAAQTAKSFGGAESNVAIGLARLGRSVGWFGQLGDDPLGRGILKTLRGERVDVSRVRLRADAPTGLMLREAVRGRLSVYYYRKGSAASRMTAAELDEAYIAQAKILHITGITPALSPTCAETIRHAVQLAKRHGVKISFDPNLRLKLWSIEQARPLLLELAEAADYFLPGLDELKLLYETEDESAILERLRRLPGVTVVKSANGSNWVLEGGRLIALPFESVPRVVDTVGAGDGFCAGFLTGILQGKTAEEAARMAGVVGALVIQAAGDWEALPTLAEVEQILGSARHIER